MADDNFSRSESVARHIALKSAKNKEQLTRQQIKVLQEHIELRAKHESKLDLEIFRERLRIVTDFGLALLVVALVVIFLQMVFSAFNAKNVLINAFDVPAAMEQQGNSGKVVASDLRDRLQALQAETRASGAKRGVSDDWSGDIKLEIPEAHISLDEIRRYLHTLLSNETHIRGSLKYAPQGRIELTVSGDSFGARKFPGETDSLANVTNQAAEYIYGAEETYRFASYLTNHDRNDEAIKLIGDHFTSVIPSDQTLLLNVWGNALDDERRFREALAKYQEAVRSDQDFWIGYNNIMEEQIALKDEEAAFETGRRMESRSRRGRLFSKAVPSHLFYVVDWLRRDLRSVHQGIVENLAKSKGHGTGNTELAPHDALILILMHDYQAAALEMETVPNAEDPYTIAQINFNRGVLALLRHDDEEALGLLEAVDSDVSRSPQIASGFEADPYCLLARAAEWAGKPQRADEDIAKNGRVVDCYCIKADVTDHRAHWVEAQKQYKEAVDLAPSLPNSYFSWGEALARHGDLDGAIAKFKEAHARGPHWADPLKSLGDALAKKGDSKGAVEQYGRAEEFAPTWGQLHLDWGRELDKLGEHESAKEQCRKAAVSSDLTDDERKLLKGWCQ